MIAAAAPASDGEVDKIAHLQEWVKHHLVDSQEWHPLPGVAIHFPSEYFSLHSMMLCIAALILIVLFCACYKKDARVPSGLTNMLETLICFIRDDVAIPNLGKKDGVALTPLLSTFFLFILTMNLMGLIPLFSTATANLGVTFGLASITFGMMVIGGMIKLGGPVGFFKAFVPSGVPWPILILLVPLEILGLIIKTAALTIRLFANLLAGHIVVLSFLAIVVAFGAWGYPAFLLALGIDLIEVLVAFLQAYVFTLLSSIFIGQVWHPDH